MDLIASTIVIAAVFIRIFFLLFDKEFFEQEHHRNYKREISQDFL